MLTNAAAKAAPARDRAYKLHDQGGLHLLVRPTGTKSWQQKYRWKGREKLLTLGQFPDVRVERARILQAEAKEKLDRGIDPSVRSDTTVSSNTFEQLARAWHRHNLPSWSVEHAADALASLERDVLPAIGTMDPASIGAPRLLEVLRAIEGRGRIATAQRVRQRMSEIFRFGIAEGLCATNPAEALGAALRDAPPATPHPALTTTAECRALLEACEQVEARPQTRLASRFLALTAVRLDAARGARWPEIDLEARVWTVPAERMKLARAKKGEGRFDHQVPLSAPAIAVLEQARQLLVDHKLPPDGLVFPGRAGGRPIGEGAILELYRRAGFAGRHVPHGWRASFSTIMNEELGEEWSRTIDRALAHSPKDKVEAAYNRAQLLERRRYVLDRWGELLCG